MQTKPEGEKSCAPIATAATSTARSAGTSAGTAAVLGRIERAKAGIILWSATSKIADLEAFYAGDEARFGRMVVDGGKSLPNANPHGWALLIRRNINDELLLRFFPEEAEAITGQLAGWNL